MLTHRKGRKRGSKEGERREGRGGEGRKGGETGRRGEKPTCPPLTVCLLMSDLDTLTRKPQESAPGGGEPGCPMGGFGWKLRGREPCQPGLWLRSQADSVEGLGLKEEVSGWTWHILKFGSPWHPDGAT